jgi:carbon monoxide dehydrogenase subunit G
MQLEERFELALAPEATWAAFHDVPLLVECLPGAALTGPVEGGEMPLSFTVKLGPISAAFAGSGKVTHDEAAKTGRFEGGATDKRTQSRVKGVASFAVVLAGKGSAVTVAVDYALSGALAQFGRGGIVRELASKLTAQFAANLEARLASGVAPADAPAALDAGSLIKDAIGSRVRSTVDRLRGRGQS